MHLNSYLFFDGQCAEAFDFYRSVFGGDFISRGTYAEAPPELGFDPALHDRIMHVSLAVGDSVLMGSDVGDRPLRTGSNYSLSCHPETVEEGKRIHQALADGGTVTFPMQETFWGSYFGMCTDRFGVHWQINVDLQG